MPEVTEPRTLGECLGEFQADTRYLLAEPALAQPQPSGGAPAAALRRCRPTGVMLLVGPEGGWTPGEAAAAAAAGCLPLTLGPRTLRADAAAIVGLTALRCVWGDMRCDALHGRRLDSLPELAAAPGGAGYRAETYRAADTRVSRAPTHSSSASRSTTVNSGAKAAITSASSSSITPLMISEPPGATA